MRRKRTKANTSRRSRRLESGVGGKRSKSRITKE